MKGSEFLIALSKLQRDDLNNIKGIGPVLIDNLTDFINSNRFDKLLQNLRQQEQNDNLLNIVEKSNRLSSNVINTHKKLSSKTICITGGFEISRNEIKDILEQNGAKVVNSITSKVDILIAGESAGSKVQKASQFGITIIDNWQSLIA